MAEQTKLQPAEFQPYVPAHESRREFTFRATLLGCTSPFCLEP